MATFKHLYDFVLANKGNTTFIGYTDNWIVYLLQRGLQEGTLLYNINANGDIDGMILAEKRPENKILFVTENLAMNLENLRKFAKVAKERLPDYKLEWLKHGIYKQHNTDKFYEKLHAA